MQTLTVAPSRLAVRAEAGAVASCRPARAVLAAPRLLLPGRGPRRVMAFPQGLSADDLAGLEMEEEEEEYLDDASQRLYLDSADLAQWHKWAEAGIFYGFTTNPSILKRDRVQCTIPSMRHLASEAFNLGAEELQLQAWGNTHTEVFSCGCDLHEIDPRIVVKVPATFDGLRAAKELADNGVPFTLTAIYKPHQVVTALAAGASYAAAYLGRINKTGGNGLDELVRMQAIVDASDQGSRLLVASIKSADEIAELAAAGCNTFTISPEVAEELVSEPRTAADAELFQEHADEMGGMRTH